MFVPEDSQYEQCLQDRVKEKDLDKELKYWDEMYPNANVFQVEEFLV